MSLGASYRFPNSFEIFGVITAESLTDPTADRSFDDFGAYIEELGIRYTFGSTTISAGKLHPVFGTAWDDTAGFYGSGFAEDYELIEQIGILTDTAIGSGVLSFGVFYADDTGLSRSAGFKRGRNTTAAGGAGNTGELDNVAVQWTQSVGDTHYHVGARYLSAGLGDVDDEVGVVLGAGHTFFSALDLYGEVASFSNFGGGVDDATYVTLNAAYAIGNLTLSGTLARRDLDTAGEADLATIAAEYEFANGWTVGAALAHVDDSGVKDDLFGINLIIPFGG